MKAKKAAAAPAMKAMKAKKGGCGARDEGHEGKEGGSGAGDEGDEGKESGRSAREGNESVNHWHRSDRRHCLFSVDRRGVGRDFTGLRSGDVAVVLFRQALSNG